MSTFQIIVSLTPVPPPDLSISLLLLAEGMCSAALYCIRPLRSMSTCMLVRAAWFVVKMLICCVPVQGEFSLEGRFPEVRENVKLVQGLFNESLPKFIKSYYRTRNPVDITYLHIDCDLYAGKLWHCAVFCLRTVHKSLA